MTAPNEAPNTADLSDGELLATMSEGDRFRTGSPQNGEKGWKVLDTRVTDRGTTKVECRCVEGYCPGTVTFSANTERRDSIKRAGALMSSYSIRRDGFLSTEGR